MRTTSMQKAVCQAGNVIARPCPTDAGTGVIVANGKSLNVLSSCQRCTRSKHGWSLFAFVLCLRQQRLGHLFTLPPPASESWRTLGFAEAVD